MVRWFGDDVGYGGMHKRVRKARGDANNHNCVSCGEQAEDWAQIHDTNRLNVNNYQPMCTKCHIEYDLGGRKCPPRCKCGRHYKSHRTEKCQPGCKCNRHISRKCPPDCKCGRHRRQVMTGGDAR